MVCFGWICFILIWDPPLQKKKPPPPPPSVPYHDLIQSPGAAQHHQQRHQGHRLHQGHTHAGTHQTQEGVGHPFYHLPEQPAIGWLWAQRFLEQKSHNFDEKICCQLSIVDIRQRKGSDFLGFCGPDLAHSGTSLWFCNDTSEVGLAQETVLIGFWHELPGQDTFNIQSPLKFHLEFSVSLL